MGHPMQDRHWNSLVASLRHGQSILVVGPEVPVGLDPGTPAGEAVGSFVDALTAELARELRDDDRRVTGNTLAAIAQQYEDAQGFGANALRARAEKLYKRPRFVPSDVHAAVARLPFSLILTTCQDDHLSRALKAAGKEPSVHCYNLRGDKRNNPEFLLLKSPQTPVVYHLFGHAQDPGSLVLSENDLLEFLIAIVSERPPLPNSLIRALQRIGQSFLFVGFGIRHWYLRVLLKVIVRALELHRTSSAIATEPLRGLSELEREQTILFYQRGMRVELEDAEIGTFLADLARRLEAEGGPAIDATTTGPRPRVFISYAREDGRLAAQVCDALQKSNFEPWLDRQSLDGGDVWNERIEDELDNTDFVLVLYTPALCRKTDSYVNKEVALARDRALKVRGPFLIPLRTADIPAEDCIPELHEYNVMPLTTDHFEDDMKKVISDMRRNYQRRNR
jgi:hypothetical protein